jgi:hypothetical protein
MTMRRRDFSSDIRMAAWFSAMVLRATGSAATRRPDLGAGVARLDFSPPFLSS